MPCVPGKSNPFVSTRDAGNDEIVDHERRARRAVVLACVGHLDIPEKLTGTAVERDQVRVVGDREHAVAEQRDSAVDAAGGIAGEAGRAGTAVVPDLAAASRIEGERFIHGGQKHHAAGHDRCDLQITRSAANGEHPRSCQVLNIPGIDRLERGEAIAVQAPVIGRPGPRLWLRDINERNADAQSGRHGMRWRSGLTCRRRFRGRRGPE